MTCPFPGMDPYLEGPEWLDFHGTLIGALREALNRITGPKYITRIERRTYFQEIEIEESDPISRRHLQMRPDLTVSMDDPELATSPLAATAMLAKPCKCVLPDEEEIEEAYLEVLEEASRSVICAIELLSPSNKSPSSIGRSTYLLKRKAVLQSSAHLVEIDLLRGGSRLPMRNPLPLGDYFAIVSRAQDRPQAAVYPWQLPQRLPQICVPLLPEDPDAVLNLQEVFSVAYARGDYLRMLSPLRDRPLIPPLAPSEKSWVLNVLAGSSTHG